MRGLLAGAVLALTALVVTPAQADLAVRVPDVTVADPAIDPDAALLRDAAHIAKTTGLPLALVEQEVLVQDEVGRLQELVAARWPATFGGLWIEQSTGLVRIGFTRNAAANVASLAGSFTKPALLRAVTVDRSYGTLKALQERMMADRAAIDAGQLAPWPGLVGTRYGLDVDVRENRPVVVTDGHTPATVAALKAAYGDLRVDATGNGSPHACTKDDCRHYLRSGLSVNLGGGPKCSSAFSVTSGYSGYETMTAGHCDGAVGYHGGGYYGAGLRARQNSGNVDAQANIVSSSEFKAGPWIYVNTSEVARAVTGMQSYAALAVGQWICKSGVTTGYTCGSVLSRDYSDPGDWQTPAHHNFILTDMCDKPGDSGAGIYIGGQAVGIISAGNNTTCASPYRGWHGHIANATSALGLIVLTSDSAPFLSSITASGTIAVRFSRPVRCSTVQTYDFTVRLQNQVNYTVTGATCTQDSNQNVTLTTNLPLIKATSITVSVSSGSIQNPGGQGITSGSRTTTVS